LRWTRTLGLLVILVLVVTGVFLNKVGLPGFVKKRLVEELRAQGWDVDFSRVRLRWRRGIVTENLHLQRANQFSGPHLFVNEAQCHLNHAAFRRLRLDVDAVKLMGGRLILPFEATNQPRRTMIFEQIGGELHFKPNDQWELSSLRTRFLGVQMQFSGTITNASAIRDWTFVRPKRRAETGALWHRITTTIQKLQFQGTPELQAQVQGDALDLKSFDVHLRLLARGIASPWGSATNLYIHSRLMPPAHSNELVHAQFRFVADEAHVSWGRAESIELKMEVDPTYNRFISSNASIALELKDPQTRWGSANHLMASAKLNPCPTNSALVQSSVEVEARQLQSDWLSATQAQLTALLSHSPTNVLPAFVAAELQASAVQTRRGNADHAEVSAQIALPPADQFQLFNTNLIWPDRISAVVCDTAVLLTNVQAREIQVEHSAVAARWKDPLLKLQATNRLADGELIASGEINAITRELSFSGFSSIDAHRISPLLSTPAQSWLANYSWQTPPKIEAQGRLLLPAWTNRQPDWPAEVQPTLAVSGRFEIGPGTYRTIPFTSAESPFAFSNLIWRLPNLKVTRPEGNLEGDYTSRPQAKEFHWRLRSQIDPKVARTFFEEETQRRAFDYVQFTTPPLIEAEIWGHWRDLNRLGVVAHVAATNFTFRGETVKAASTRLIYTNKLFNLIEPQIRREGEYGSAPGVTIDLRAQKVYLTNVLGNLDPHAVARAIGKGAARAIEPYQFDSPPTIRVEGVADIKPKRYEEDLHFEISGGPFRWRQFRLQQLAGNVAWQGKRVNLLNVGGIVFGGLVTGNALFDFTEPKEATFSFNTMITNVDLRSLVLHLAPRTNKLEGLLSGELIVVRAVANDPQTWQGGGHIYVRDGLLWDIPVLGLFSGILNTIIPGLGNSRAKEATADFVITNGLIGSENLEIHATAMRMQLKGTVDFERRVDLRVEAELLRDVPAIGFFVSKLFWPVTKLFEYKITGTLNQPRAEPLYVIPKILLFPFQPIKTIKELFPPDSKALPEK
jgi:hypothetical protein